MSKFIKVGPFVTVPCLLLTNSRIVTIYFAHSLVVYLHACMFVVGQNYLAFAACMPV
jgi:hypothetical protein